MKSFLLKEIPGPGLAFSLEDSLTLVGTVDQALFYLVRSVEVRPTELYDF